jgi:TM2 domain-containing membrane protein YozV
MTLEKIKELASKGQLSRAHELSSDGKNWEPAGNTSHIFDRTSPVDTNKNDNQNQTKEGESGAPVGVKKSADDPPANSSDPTGGSVSPPASAKEWFYSIDGSQLGPVTPMELAGLIRHGVLSGNSLVWRAGMPKWAALGYLPDFVGMLSHNSKRSSGGSGKSKVAAVLLAVFLGGFGIHHFYLGNTLRGSIQLCLFILTCGIMWIVALVEAVLIAFSSEEDFNEKWCNLEMRWFS